MKLLDEIIAGATTSAAPIADLLRHCLVLAYKLKNDKLKAWVEQELNGYEYYGTIPGYRVVSGLAKGTFINAVRQLNSQPIPSYLLKPEHRHFCREARLIQPIAAYEDVGKNPSGSLSWPADLVAMYQDKIIDNMTLHSAWIEVSTSAMAGLKDVVRTRIRTFGLEIQSELPADTEQAMQALPAATVDRLVAVHIYGGNVNIGDGGIINANTVIAGDAESLRAALEGLGLGDQHAAELQAAIAEDGKADGLGKKTLAWIGKTAKAGGRTRRRRHGAFGRMLS